jgi:hypothetical protein
MVNICTRHHQNTTKKPYDLPAEYAKFWEDFCPKLLIKDGYPNSAILEVPDGAWNC